MRGHLFVSGSVCVCESLPSFPFTSRGSNAYFTASIGSSVKLVLLLYIFRIRMNSTITEALGNVDHPRVQVSSVDNETAWTSYC